MRTVRKCTVDCRSASWGPSAVRGHAYFLKPQLFGNYYRKTVSNILHDSVCIDSLSRYSVPISLNNFWKFCRAWRAFSQKFRTVRKRFDIFAWFFLYWVGIWLNNFWKCCRACCCTQIGVVDHTLFENILTKLRR